jgi:hypothetical protein
MFSLEVILKKEHFLYFSLPNPKINNVNMKTHNISERKLNLYTRERIETPRGFWVIIPSKNLGDPFFRNAKRPKLIVWLYP